MNEKLPENLREVVARGRVRMPPLKHLEDWDLADVPDEVRDDQLGSLDNAWRTEATRRGYRLRKVPGKGGRQYCRVPDAAFAEEAARKKARKDRRRKEWAESMNPPSVRPVAGRYNALTTRETGDLVTDLLAHADAAHACGDDATAETYMAGLRDELIRLDRLPPDWKPKPVDPAESVPEDERREMAARMAHEAAEELRDAMSGRDEPTVRPMSIDERIVALSDIAAGVPDEDDSEDWSDLDVPDTAGDDSIPV